MADVGEVFVDAGCIWVGDPCYVMGDDASKRVHDWQKDFCDKLDHSERVNEPLGKGMGLCIDSGYGDGRYRVEVITDRVSGRNAQVIITFIDRDEDVEEEY